MREIIKHKFVWFAALGYFVDLFDLVLYGVVRVESLQSIGYSNQDVFRIGAQLLNFQMAGMLIGGFLWGIIGDRRGRREALFGSIFIYSTATFLNAYVHSYEAYAALRFLAGIGLAGELGAAITLVSEGLPQKSRGLGSAFIASVGFLGAALSSYVSQSVSWQNAYRIGGSLGFILLLARVNIPESVIYLKSKRESPESTHWGSLSLLFSSRSRLKLFLLAFCAGVPIWYVAGILSYFAPEFARELKTVGIVTAGTTIMMGYMGSILGDIACGYLSQLLQSRKKAVFIFMSFGGLLAILHPYFMVGGTASEFYWMRFAIGFGNGFFAILIAWVAEIFGTNLRATVSTSISNLIRASVIPLTLSFQGLTPSLGLIESAVILGVFCFGIALLCISRLPETFHRDLKFNES
jgi:putative MFS transporter